MMPETIKRLRDALNAARLIAERTGGRTRVEYESDPWLRSAAERQLEIIGEAFNHARRLNPELEQLIPDFHGWISMRHFIAHLYDRIDHEIAWDTIEREIPELIVALEAMVDTDA